MINMQPKTIRDEFAMAKPTCVFCGQKMRNNYAECIERYSKKLDKKFYFETCLDCIGSAEKMIDKRLPILEEREKGKK